MRQDTGDMRQDTGDMSEILMIQSGKKQILNYFLNYVLFADIV